MFFDSSKREINIYKAIRKIERSIAKLENFLEIDGDNIPLSDGIKLEIELLKRRLSEVMQYSSCPDFDVESMFNDGNRSS